MKQTKLFSIKRLNGTDGLLFTLLSVGVLCCLILIFAARANAQGTNATLSGSITDPVGAAIPNAQVTVRNTGTNLTRSAQTNGAGVYIVSDLPPGTYNVTAIGAGFKTEVQDNLILTVAQSATLNLSLTVGTQQQTVTVTSGAEVINTTSAAISTVVDQHAIEQLPLNGRNPGSLVLLAPGVSNVLNSSAGLLQGTNVFNTETGASAGGGQQGSTYYLLDGVPNFDTYLLLALPFPNADATQEFRVITNNFEAQYGFSPGAIVTIQTRSGTNSFHGGAFEFLRNNDLNAGNYFTHRVDPLKRNQFGGQLGGPLIKDKLFFFGNYQGTKAIETAATLTAFTPTTAMLRGDFSAVPLTLGAPFATVAGVPNQVNPALFSPGAVGFTNELPLGQTPSTGQVNFIGSPTDFSYEEGTGRLDYNLSNNQQLFFRSYINYVDQVSTPINGNALSTTGGSGSSQNPAGSQKGRIYSFVLGHTWTIKPTLLNVARISWLRDDFASSAIATNQSGGPVCLSQYMNAADPAGQCFLDGPTISDGFTGPSGIPNRVVRTTYWAADSLSLIRGNHSITAGFNLAHQYSDQTSNYLLDPIVSVSGYVTGFGLADYLLGQLSSYQQGSSADSPLRGWQVGIFGQDVYKIRPNLSITAGLRWEPNLPPYAILGGAAFVPGQQSTRFPGAPTGLVFPGDKGINGNLMPNSYGYFQPRVGIAFQPHSLPKTAFRVGFGMFTGPLPYFYYNSSGAVAPFSAQYVQTGTPTNHISWDNPWVTNAPTGGKNPFPPFLQNPNAPSNTVFLKPVTVSTVFATNFKNLMTQSWTASVEQQLRSDLAFHLAYVGSETYHESLSRQLNPGIFSAGSKRITYPEFNGIGQQESTGTASYNALQVGIEKRLSHNFQLQSNFTWSKTIDITSGELARGVSDPFDLLHDRGISGLDVHLISITNFVYTTPTLGNLNFLARNALGGWQVSGIYTMQSGQPFSVSGGNGNNNSGSLVGSDRADVTGQPYLQHQGGKQHWLHQYFNPAAFKTNAPGTFGDSYKHILTGPGINTADIGLGKTFTLKENYNLQFRWEMFNAFNHASFATPTANPTSPSNGEITSIGPIPPRVMQGALKLNF
jgi:hypothetical protein